MAELRELDVLDVWRRPPGTLDRWVRWAIGVAAIATIVLPIAGARVLWFQGGEATHLPAWWFQHGLGVLAGFWVAVSFLPKWGSVSRFVRLAALLPVAHLVLACVAWPLWLHVAPQMEHVQRWDAMVRALPISAVLAGQLAVISLAAWIVARKRRDAGFAHAFVMIALVDLLVLGTWLPIAAWLACRGSEAAEINPDLAMIHPIRLAAAVIAPPLISAIAYSALAIRRPEVARRARSQFGGIFVSLLATAVVLRVDATPAARVVYSNFIHVLLAAMVVACGGLVSLAVALWWRARAMRIRLARDHTSVTAIVARDQHFAPLRGAARSGEAGPCGDEPIVGCIEIASWLRGPRPLVRPFIATTATGDVPIHGAWLAAPIAPATTALRVGESLPVIAVGDRIVLSGITSDRGGPFRASAAPIAGADVVIAPHAAARFGFVDVALGLWRPALAYLVILVALAAPALAALAATPR